MALANLPVDINVQGHLSATTFTAPASCVTNAAVAANAAIDADKLQHQHAKHYSQAHGSVVASAIVCVHTVKGATAVLRSIDAVLTVACAGAATVTVDVYKNSVSTGSLLSAVISHGSGDAAFTEKAGTITSPNLVDGDNLILVVVATAGGGTIGQGLSVELRIDEDTES